MAVFSDEEEIKPSQKFRVPPTFAGGISFTESEEHMRTITMRLKVLVCEVTHASENAKFVSPYIKKREGMEETLLF